MERMHKARSKEPVYLSKLPGHPSIWSFYRGVGNIWTRNVQPPVHVTRRCDGSSVINTAAETSEVTDLVTLQQERAS